MNKLRDIFMPSVEKRIKTTEKLIQLHNEHIGRCSTCDNHIPVDVPGFVTDYGFCKVESPIFEAKVCGLIDEGCPLYLENVSSLNRMKDELKKLKEELSESESSIKPKDRMPMEKYLVDYGVYDINTRHYKKQLLYRFENGYGASVICSEVTGLHGPGLWELAVIKWDVDLVNYKWHLCYTTPITDDVISDLRFEDIEPILNDIKNLKRRMAMIEYTDCEKCMHKDVCKYFNKAKDKAEEFSRHYQFCDLAQDSMISIEFKCNKYKQVTNKKGIVTMNKRRIIK